MVACTVEKTMARSKNKGLFQSKSISTEGRTPTVEIRESAIWTEKSIQTKKTI